MPFPCTLDTTTRTCRQECPSVRKPSQCLSMSSSLSSLDASQFAEQMARLKPKAQSSSFDGVTVEGRTSSGSELRPLRKISLPRTSRSSAKRLPAACCIRAWLTKATSYACCCISAANCSGVDQKTICASQPRSATMTTIRQHLYKKHGKGWDPRSHPPRNIPKSIPLQLHYHLRTRSRCRAKAVSF